MGCGIEKQTIYHPTNEFRVDAFVLNDGTTLRRRVWLKTSTTGADGLPWQVLSREPVSAAAPYEAAALAAMGGDDGGS